MGQLTVTHPTNAKSSLQSLKREERTGVSFPRFFTAKLEPNKTPYDLITWELRTATIGSDKGSVIFEQRDVEVPAEWSQTATNIVASKYFHGRMGTPERETSVAQLVHRVVDTITDWGRDGNYFKTKEELGEAVVERRLSDFRAFREQMERLSSPKERLLAFVDGIQRNKDQLARALTQKLVTYATGATVQQADHPEVEAIVRGVRDRNHGLRSLVHAIVQSRLFRYK